eukprot:6379297-Prymnesium_polylepis.1
MKEQAFDAERLLSTTVLNGHQCVGKTCKRAGATVAHTCRRSRWRWRRRSHGATAETARGRDFGHARTSEASVEHVGKRSARAVPTVSRPDRD